jgi:hypothetical protein
MRYRILLATMALGLTVWVGPVTAEEEWARREVATIRFIDRAANIVELTNGTELHTTDRRMLVNLKEGQQVLVDYVHDEGTNELNSITPVAPGAAVDAPAASPFSD